LAGARAGDVLGLAKVGENLGQDRRIAEGGQDSHGAQTAGTDQDVHRNHPAQELRPGQTLTKRPHWLGGLKWCVAVSIAAGWVLVDGCVTTVVSGAVADLQLSLGAGRRFIYLRAKQQVQGELLVIWSSPLYLGS